MLRWDRPSLQKSHLPPELGSQQALASQLPHLRMGLCVRPPDGDFDIDGGLMDSESSGRIFLLRSQVTSTDFLGTG